MSTENAPPDISWGSLGPKFGWFEYEPQPKNKTDLQKFYLSGYTSSFSDLPRHLKPWSFGPRAPENTREKDDANCPTALEHLGTFSPEFVASLSDRYMETPSTIAYYIDSHRTWNFGQFALRNPDLGFGRGTNMYRDLRLLFVQHLYLGTNTRTHHAVIRFDYQCLFCHEAKRKGNWAPCFDPFIEAKNGKLGVRFDGVVAFFNRHTKIVVLREDWCWQTLKMEREVVAVYSRRKNRNKFNCFKRGWIYWKTGWPIREEREVNGITYIEDLYDRGYTRRMKGSEDTKQLKGDPDCNEKAYNRDNTRSNSIHSSPTDSEHEEDRTEYQPWWKEAGDDDTDSPVEGEVSEKLYEEKYGFDENAMHMEGISEGSIESYYGTDSHDQINEKDYHQWEDYQSYHH